MTDLTIDRHAGEAAEVVQVIASSEDGSYVYFAAAGALTEGAAAEGGSPYACEQAGEEHKGIGRRATCT